MTSNQIARRGGRGLYHKGRPPLQKTRKNGATLPEYLELGEVRALLDAAAHAQARLLFLIQWRAGLRISEAVALEPADLTLGVDRPTLRVRRGKGRRTRIGPVHPELAAGLTTALDYARRRPGPIVDISRSTGLRWVKAAVARATEFGGLRAGRTIGTHTLRHSYARRLLVNGIPINYVSRWLGHSPLSTTLVYLELVPDPAGTLAGVP